MSRRRLGSRNLQLRASRDARLPPTPAPFWPAFGRSLERFGTDASLESPNSIPSACEATGTFGFHHGILIWVVVIADVR